MAADLAKVTACKILRVMPFGDSITYGVIGSDDTGSGGYRKVLADRLAAQGVVVDFVGSLANGPTTFDRDHEGRRGWSIDELEAEAVGLVETADPDAVLLLAGTNDTKNDTADQMIADLRELVSTIGATTARTTLLVVSIPQIRGETKGEDRQRTADAFNAALPALVEELQADGHEVAFVDMRALTVDDISAPPSSIRPISIAACSISPMPIRASRSRARRRCRRRIWRCGSIRWATRRCCRTTR